MEPDFSVNSVTHFHHQKKLYFHLCQEVCVVELYFICTFLMSISTIDNFFAQKRRVQAVDELIRILKPGGRGLIYVWALEQERNKEKSNYLKDSSCTADQTKERDVNNLTGNNENASSSVAQESLSSLPVHVNRTQFKAQDLLVPWHLRKNSNNSSAPGTYLRYYHVFVEGELEALVNESQHEKRVKIIESYYDKGNWCVIFEKIS